MNFKSWQIWVIFFVVSLAPIVALLVRGLVWGADSFAYWSVSCGNYSIISWIHSPTWFVWFLQNVINCNFYVLVCFQFIAYLAILISIWQIGKRYFAHQAWRLPIYVGCLTPLFFIEVLRFEHELFGIALAFVAVALISWQIEKDGWFICLIIALASIIGITSINLWLPSVLILCLVFFLLKLPKIVHKIGFIALLLVFLATQFGYILGSFNFINIVAEELPFVGLIFVFYLLPFWKDIPSELKWYSLFLIAFGALKSKYMFLAAPLLCIGLLDKQLKQGIVLKRQIFGIKEIPVLYMCGILLIGWCLMGINLYPTQSDLKEMSYAITYASDNNFPLHNTWGDGWMFVSLGYDTNYKISPPEPDWNKLTRPYIAWTDLNIVGCERISKRTQQCN